MCFIWQQSHPFASPLIHSSFFYSFSRLIRLIHPHTKAFCFSLCPPADPHSTSTEQHRAGVQKMKKSLPSLLNLHPYCEPLCNQRFRILWAVRFFDLFKWSHMDAVIYKSLNHKLTSKLRLLNHYHTVNHWWGTVLRFAVRKGLNRMLRAIDLLTILCRCTLI